MRTHLASHSIFAILIALFLYLASCKVREWAVPENLAGEWRSDMTKITVRTEPKWMRFNFTSDISFVRLTVNSNKTASGFIGAAEFKNGIVLKNGGDPERTGVAYIIRCGTIGKIFSADPLNAKKVELWLGPVKGEMHAGLRYTEGNAQFPMANLVFRKVHTN